MSNHTGFQKIRNAIMVKKCMAYGSVFKYIMHRRVSYVFKFSIVMDVVLADFLSLYVFSVKCSTSWKGV